MNKLKQILICIAVVLLAGYLIVIDIAPTWSALIMCIAIFLGMLKTFKK